METGADSIKIHRGYASDLDDANLEVAQVLDTILLVFIDRVPRRAYVLTSLACQRFRSTAMLGKVAIETSTVRSSWAKIGGAF